MKLLNTEEKDSDGCATTSSIQSELSHDRLLAFRNRLNAGIRRVFSYTVLMARLRLFFNLLSLAIIAIASLLTIPLCKMWLIWSSFSILNSKSHYLSFHCSVFSHWNFLNAFYQMQTVTMEYSFILENLAWKHTVIKYSWI